MWTGIVDTDFDFLEIYTWEEQPDSIDYWSPAAASLSMVWPAVDNTGAPFDVPDSFDGVIDSTFAFISSQSVHEIEWKEESTEPGGLKLPLAATFYPGWGGARYIPNQQTEPVFDTSWNQEYMPKLLTSPNGLGIVAADDGIVSIVAHGSISPVPEASPVLIWSVLTSGGAYLLWRRRLREPGNGRIL